MAQTKDSNPKYGFLGICKFHLHNNLINQMDIEAKTIESIKALQNQRIINENIIQLFIE